MSEFIIEKRQQIFRSKQKILIQVNFETNHLSKSKI